MVKKKSSVGNGLQKIKYQKHAPENYFFLFLDILFIIKQVVK